MVDARPLRGLPSVGKVPLDPFECGGVADPNAQAQPVGAKGDPCWPTEAGKLGHAGGGAFGSRLDELAHRTTSLPEDPRPEKGSGRKATRAHGEITRMPSKVRL